MYTKFLCTKYVTLLWWNYKTVTEFFSNASSQLKTIKLNYLLIIMNVLEQ